MFNIFLRGSLREERGEEGVVITVPSEIEVEQ